MTPSKYNSPTVCLDILKSNKANDFFKLEDDLFGKPAASLFDPD